MLTSSEQEDPDRMLGQLADPRGVIIQLSSTGTTIQHSSNQASIYREFFRSVDDSDSDASEPLLDPLFGLHDEVLFKGLHEDHRHFGKVFSVVGRRIQHGTDTDDESDEEQGEESESDEVDERIEVGESGEVATNDEDNRGAEVAEEIEDGNLDEDDDDDSLDSFDGQMELVDDVEVPGGWWYMLAATTTDCQATIDKKKRVVWYHEDALEFGGCEVDDPDKTILKSDGEKYW